MIPGIPFALFASASLSVIAASLVWLAHGAGSPAGAAGAYPTIDLLRTRTLGGVLRWRPFRPILQVLFVALFLLVIATGLFGVQQPGSNAATVLTWTYWWILLVLSAMLLGKAWCYVCPWDALAGWLQRLSLWGPGRWPLTLNLRWPAALRNLYPAATLFVVLTWLELGYGVTSSPAMTAVLALVMFFLAFVPALVFDRSAFCRYGCLVGRISGLYALFAPLELRSRDRGTCEKTCRTRDCYHGNARGNPCPTSQYLGGMTKNTYCIMCGECVFTCPHDNVALNLRPPAADLYKAGAARPDEAAMVVIMLSMSTFHGATMTPWWQSAVDGIAAGLGLPFLGAFTVGMAAFLATLSLLYFVVVAATQLMADSADSDSNIRRLPAYARQGLSRATARSRRSASDEPAREGGRRLRRFGLRGLRRSRLGKTPGFRQLAVRFAYAFVPIALFYHVAHNTMHFAMEGGAIVPLLSNPFGWGWNLFGTATFVPGPLLPPAGVELVMLGLVVAGHVWSLAIANRIAGSLYPHRPTAVRALLPIFAGMTAYSIVSLWIVAQPMVMRTAL